MNNKKIIITILSFIILFAISCKSNEDPAQFKPSDLIGTWSGWGNSFTIDSYRNLNFDYKGVNYKDNAFKHMLDVLLTLYLLQRIMIQTILILQSII